VSVLVLCYHAVSERWPASLSVTPEALRRQLTALVDAGWQGTRFTRALTEAPARRALVVTFDDAFVSVGALAAPVLAELGLPGTLFVPTDWPGRRMVWPGIDGWVGTEHEPELQAMGWDAIGELADAGWEVGAHTCSHPRLTQVADDDVLRHELVDGRAAVERELARPCRSIAYPFGDVDDRVRSAAAAAGYEAGAGLGAQAFVRASRLEWPRVGVYHEDGALRFRLKVAGPTRRLQGSAAVAAVDEVRRRRRHRANAARATVRA